MGVADPTNAAKPRRVQHALAVSITLLIALVPAALWPGDISWVNDEPRLIANAYHANRAALPAARGLRGNFGISYGPVATQFYQVMLLITHDPVKLAAIRAIFSAGLTTLALLWLARSLQFSPWFAAAVSFAPALWLYHRLLWDASFAIPIGMLALAAYAAFLRNGSRRALLVSVTCTVALPFIHPQALPLFTPLAGHMAWTMWRIGPGRRQLQIYALFAAGVVLAFNAIYLYELGVAIAQQLAGAVRTGYPGTDSRVTAMFGPLLGGRLLDASGFGQLHPAPNGLGSIAQLATLCSRVVYPLNWIGIVISGRRAFSWCGCWRDERLRAGRSNSGNRDHNTTRTTVLALAFAGLVLQILLFGLMRIPSEPQYFFGTAALQILFAWVGIEAIANLRHRLAVMALYGVSVAVITISTMCQIHWFGYDRVSSGRPTLQNQVDVVRALNRHSDAFVLTNVPILAAYPQSLRSLRLLLPPSPALPQTQSGRLLIRYQSGPDGRDSRIEFSEMTAGADPPAGAKRIEITPLPRGWEPGR